MVLGFGAFVVTPVIVPFLAVGAGLLVGKLARHSPWIGIAVSAAAASAAYAIPFLILAIVNRSFDLGPTLVGALVSGAVGVIAAALLALGAWIGGAWRGQSNRR